MKTARRKFQELERRAREIRELYAIQANAAGRSRWGAAEYLQGFVGDVGALAKLVMRKNGVRADGASERELDAKLAHELADCLWSVLVLADELGVDLERAFFATMAELQARFPEKSAKSARGGRTKRTTKSRGRTGGALPAKSDRR